MNSCSEDVLFYLLYAKHLWKKESKIDKAIEILSRGISKLKDEEELYIAIIKLY